MRDPAAVLARAAERLDAEDERIRVILRGEPFRDERKRDPEIIAADWRDALDRERDGLVAAAARAARAADEARQALTIWDRWLPWDTVRQRASTQAADRLKAATDLLTTFRREIEARREAIKRTAVRTALKRTRERTAWLDRPDVQEAMADRRRSQERREAIRHGDLQVAAELLRRGDVVYASPTEMTKPSPGPTGPRLPSVDEVLLSEDESRAFCV